MHLNEGYSIITTECFVLELKYHSAGCQPISFSFSLVILLLYNCLTQAGTERCWLLIPFPKTSPPQGTLCILGHLATVLLQDDAKRIKETSLYLQKNKLQICQLGSRIKLAWTMHWLSSRESPLPPQCAHHTQHKH